MAESIQSKIGQGSERSSLGLGRWLGNLALEIAWAGAAPALYAHHKTREDFWGRWGFPERPPSGLPVIWFHGASAGDVQALLPLMAALQRRRPHQPLLTAFTASGLQTARRHAGWVRAAPFDAPSSVRRFLGRVRPSLVVLERAELWPQLLLELRRRGVPVVVVNATIRGDRLARHRRLLSMFGGVESLVDLALGRYPEDAHRLMELGLPKQRVEVVGDTKLDGLSTSRPIDSDLARAVGSGPLWAVTSCHQSEEEGLLRAAHQVGRRARLLMAPRELRRVPAILRKANRRGLTARRRTQGAAHAEVVVLDTHGELRTLLGRAEVAVLGGSFSRREGQNPYEAAVAQCAQVFGPRTLAQEHAVRALIEFGGAIRVDGLDSLGATVIGLLEDGERRKMMGRAGLAFVRAHQGASERAAERLDRLVHDERAPPSAT